MHLLKAKSDALASLKKFFFSVETPKKLRQDNAKEFLSEQFKTYCLDAGILQEKTILETPQNGLAERCTRTLLEAARCLLIDSSFPKMIWGAAIFQSTRIRYLAVWWREEKRPAALRRDINLNFQLVNYLILLAQSSWGKGTHTSANWYWKESLWVTLKEITDAWCTHPTRWWQF